MPARSVITGLPSALRRELDRRLIRSRFSGYVALATWLCDQGYPVSKTTVGKYSKALRAERLAPSRCTQATSAEQRDLASVRATCLAAAASQVPASTAQTLKRASRYAEWVLTGR